MNWSQRIEQWARETESSSDLQKSWLIGLCLITVGSALFVARCLGAISGAGDGLLFFGAILAVLGLGVMCLGYQLQFSPSTRSIRDQRLTSASFTSLGTLLTAFALLPVDSLLLTLLLAPVLAGLVALTSIRFLAVLTREIVDETKHEQELEQAAHATPPSHEFSTARDENLVQWMSRKSQENGSELLEGMLRVELIAGQKQKSAHALFSPSLASVPDIECEPLDDVDIEATVGEAYPHGFRIDVRRLDSCDVPLTVDIGFQAIAAGKSRQAA